MTLDLDALESIAREALAVAPGPYTVQWTDRGVDEPVEERGVDYILDANREHVIVGDSGVYPPHGPVAMHIAAAHPAVVLALVRVAKAAEYWAAREADRAGFLLRGESDLVEAVDAMRSPVP